MTLDEAAIEAPSAKAPDAKELQRRQPSTTDEPEGLQANRRLLPLSLLLLLSPLLLLLPLLFPQPSWKGVRGARGCCRRRDARH